MPQISLDILRELAYALGIGLFVGLERQQHVIARYRELQESAEDGAKTESPSDTILGMRTFALVSMLGWACAHLGTHWAWLPPLGLVVVGGFVLASYVTVRDKWRGLTTEIAAIVTYLIGLVVTFDQALAVVLALATTLLLLSKPFLGTFSAKVRRLELEATVQLLILLAIVLPLLPAEPIDPWDAIEPRKIGLFVILIGGIDFVGYVLSRIFGQRRSAGLTGLVGGLTSSTAVTAAMAQAAHKSKAMQVPGQLATFLANAVLFPRVIIITSVLSRELALHLALPLAGMGVIMLLGALWKWRALKAENGSLSDSEEEEEEEEEEHLFDNPFALVPALKWGLILCAVLLLAAVARDLLGDRGLLAASAASGLADVDAITLGVAGHCADGSLGVDIGSLAIALAVISNTVVKGVIAFFAGGRQFGADIAKVFSLAILVGGLIAARVLV